MENRSDNGDYDKNFGRAVRLCPRLGEPRVFVSSIPLDFFRLVRWQGFLSTELHTKLFRVVFYDEADDVTKGRFRELALGPLRVLDERLSQREFMVGDAFSVADAELAWIGTLLPRAGVDVTPFERPSAHGIRKQVPPAPFSPGIAAPPRWGGAPSGTAAGR